MPEVANFKNYVRRLYAEDADGKFEADLSDGSVVSLSTTSYVTQNANVPSVLAADGTALQAPANIDPANANATHNVGVPLVLDNEKDYTIQVDWRRVDRGLTWAGEDSLSALSYRPDLTGGSGYTLSEFELLGRSAGTALLRVGPGIKYWDDRVNDDATETGFFLRLRGDVEVTKIVVAEGDRTTETLFLNGVGIGSNGDTISMPKLLVGGDVVKGFTPDGDRLSLSLNSSSGVAPGKIVGLNRADNVGRLAGLYNVGDPALPWKDSNGQLVGVDGTDFATFEYGMIKLLKPGRYEFSFTVTWVGVDIGARIADINLGSGGSPKSVLVPAYVQNGNSYLEHRFVSDIRYIDNDTQYASYSAFWSPLGPVTDVPAPAQFSVRCIRLESTS